MGRVSRGNPQSSGIQHVGVRETMTQPSGPAIDSTAFGALEEIADGDAEFMVELLNQFLGDSEELVGVLAPALAAGDGEALERAAHTLKSSSANVGEMILSAMCEVLQNAGRGGDLSGMGEAVPAAEVEYGRVKDELNERLSKLAS